MTHGLAPAWLLAIVALCACGADPEPSDLGDPSPTVSSSVSAPTGDLARLPDGRAMYVRCTGSGSHRDPGGG